MQEVGLVVPQHLPALPAYQLALPSGAAVTVRTQLLGPMGLSEHQLALLRRHVPAKFLGAGMERLQTVDPDEGSNIWSARLARMM